MEPLLESASQASESTSSSTLSVGRDRSGNSDKTIPQPDGRPKVRLGTGRDLGFIADTLFDDDLNG